MTRVRRLCVIALLTSSAAACQPSLSREQTILNWLTCDECTASERTAVRNLRANAVPYLAGVMDSVPEVILGPLRTRLTNSWSPALHPNQTEYVNFYVDNARAQALVRAARSLGDLNAVTELQTALDSAAVRNYRADVIAAIRGALRAPTDSAAVTTIRIAPTTHTMAVGQRGQLAVFANDSMGNLLSSGVTWSSSNPAVVTVDQSGRLTPVAPGVATIVVRSQANPNAQAASVITVLAVGPTVYVVRDSAGNAQVGTSGAVLPQSLLVKVMLPPDSPAQGVQVTWKYLLGGGTVTPVPAGGRGGATPGQTNAAGVAAAEVKLGSTGPQRIEVRVSNSPAIVFRATAN